MTRRESTAAGVDPDDVLTELLIECRDGVRTCFEIGNDTEYGDSRFEAMTVPARLMKTSLALAAALKKNPDFTHRIIVERAAADLPPPEFPTAGRIARLSRGGAARQQECGQIVQPSTRHPRAEASRPPAHRPRESGACGVAAPATRWGCSGSWSLSSGRALRGPRDWPGCPGTRFVQSARGVYPRAALRADPGTGRDVPARASFAALTRWPG